MLALTRDPKHFYTTVGHKVVPFSRSGLTRLVFLYSVRKIINNKYLYFNARGPRGLSTDVGFQGFAELHFPSFPYTHVHDNFTVSPNSFLNRNEGN